jgi:hypothetical protein
MSESLIPPGFKLLQTGLGFTDMIQPVYRHLSDEGIHFGLIVSDVHTNTMGICHGGVLMTFADIAAASAVNFLAGKRAGSPTINLSLDFVSPGRLGEWLYINNQAGLVARFNGTFYLPEHKGMWKDKKTETGPLAVDGDS